MTLLDLAFLADPFFFGASSRVAVVPVMDVDLGFTFFSFFFGFSEGGSLLSSPTTLSELAFVLALIFGSSGAFFFFLAGTFSDMVDDDLYVCQNKKIVRKNQSSRSTFLMQFFDNFE